MHLEKTIKGIILRIERASIHDGQGLRTVIFFKGCPLKCSWCSTPESHSFEPEKGYDPESCTGCGKCVAACPSVALSLSPHGNKVVTDTSLCALCYKCVEVCPSNAVKKYGLTLSIEEAVAEISKDEIFYFHSSGGVTISGGEPLSQPDFVSAILKESKKLGIHTAIESSLHVSYEAVEQVIPYLDVLYVDIKHMDSKTHYEWIGEGNRLILENIVKADSATQPLDIIIRIPLIPGFNDSDENLIKTLQYSEMLQKATGIELLPYHRLGLNTYGYLGKDYPCRELVVPNPEYLSERAAFLKKHARTIPVKIGSGFTSA